MLVQPLFNICSATNVVPVKANTLYYVYKMHVPDHYPNGDPSGCDASAIEYALFLVFFQDFIFSG